METFVGSTRWRMSMFCFSTRNPWRSKNGRAVTLASVKIRQVDRVDGLVKQSHDRMGVV